MFILKMLQNYEMGQKRQIKIFYKYSFPQTFNTKLTSFQHNC